MTTLLASAEMPAEWWKSAAENGPVLLLAGCLYMLIQFLTRALDAREAKTAPIPAFDVRAVAEAFGQALAMAQRPLIEALATTAATGAAHRATLEQRVAHTEQAIERAVERDERIESMVGQQAIALAEARGRESVRTTGEHGVVKR